MYLRIIYLCICWIIKCLDCHWCTVQTWKTLNLGETCHRVRTWKWRFHHWVWEKKYSASFEIFCFSLLVTETSGRLHPLWPQNKLLHTPRTIDYRHTRQDTSRWIQTELAFTLANNATKPNPFEIIPLQTTRKENNWKTEEVLARAAVTLETGRIKGSNPWCLWW